jgi:copper(I)-binding protein
LIGLLAVAGGLAACTTSDEEADTRAVLHAILAMDNAGLHGMDEAANNDGEIPSAALDTMVRLQVVIELTPWPGDLEEGADGLQQSFADAAGLISVENPDIEAVGAALAKVHDEEHEFSHTTWEWLREEAGIEAPQAPAAASPTAAASVGDITIMDPSVRFTLGNTAAAYFTVHNAGEEDRLVSASSSIEGAEVQIHETVTEGATSRMQEVDGGLVVPGDGEVALEPGGYHVMFMNIDPPLEDGDEVTVTLVFEDAGETSFTVPALQRSASNDGGAMPTMGHN